MFLAKQTQFIKYPLILAAIFISIYIGQYINFFNNDDWVHYKTVENFLNGDFNLHPYIGSTFYTQGLMAFIFAKLFGENNIPVLTLIISALNIFVFWEILNLLSAKNIKLKILSIILLVLNPLYLYSSVGFMTENFVIFFLLLAIYFHIKFRHTNLIHSYLFTVLGFFVKQYSIFLGAATIVHAIFRKKWHLVVLHFTLAVSLLLFYYFLFPKNEILSGQSVQIAKLLDIKSIISSALNIFLYLNFFTIPLAVIFGMRTKANKVYTFILSLVIFVTYIYLLPIHDFPSIGNVFTQKGLFPDIVGNKSQWAGYYKFFTFTFYLSALTASIVISRLVLDLKNVFFKNRFLFIGFFIYFGLCLILPNFYDRYILPLLILWIPLMFSSSFNFKIKLPVLAIITAWLFIYGFFNYLYIVEYIARNIEIENATQELVLKGVPRANIVANRAHNNYYGNSPDRTEYFFNFDNPKTLGQESATLEKTLQINFPLNIFISKEIYLYKIQK